MHLIFQKKISEVKVVINGAGASAMACANLFTKTGVNLKIILQCLIVKVLLIQKER